MIKLRMRFVLGFHVMNADKFSCGFWREGGLLITLTQVNYKASDELNYKYYWTDSRDRKWIALFKLNMYFIFRASQLKYP